LDTAGQDEYSIFHPQYSIGIHGYILVYSVTSKSSLELIVSLNDKILNALGIEKVPRLLLGNKCDLNMERQVSREDGQTCATHLGCAFLECSAKQNLNINDAFVSIIAEVEKSSNPENFPENPKGGCILL